MKPLELTRAETIMVLADRGQKLTGFPIHVHKHKVGKVDAVSYYFWPWGTQPGGLLLSALTAGNPSRAAEKFLLLFHARPGSIGCYSRPQPRSSAEDNA